MYQVLKDGMTFFVTEEEKAKRYAEEGYDIFSVDKLRVNEEGEFEKDENVTEAKGTGESEKLPEAEAHTIGG